MNNTGGGGGGSRVLIPNSVWNTIHDIKEIAAKHSDEDIYAMLKECNMDPNETAQKLLYLDTFQEVKKKRDSRKMNVNGRVSEESRLRTGTQGRGFRGGLGHYSSSHISHGAGGGRNPGTQKENGVSNRMERVFNTPPTVPEKTEKKFVTNASNISVNGPTSVSNDSSGYKHAPQSSAASLSVLGAYSSASDPVVPPPINSRNPAVDAVKCKVSSQRIALESGASYPAVNGSIVSRNVANNIQATLGDGTSTKALIKESLTVEKNQPLEPSQPSSLTIHYGSLEALSIQDGQSSQQQIGPSEVVASEATTLAVEAGSKSRPELNVSVVKDGISKLDVKLEKLHISSNQAVIFPDHLQVPEEIKNGLIFGSLDYEQSVNCGNGPDDSEGSLPAPELLQENNKAAEESSLSDLSLSSTAREENHQDNPHSPPHVVDNSAHLKDNVESGVAPNYGHLKQEIMFSHGGPQYPFVHIGPNYGFPFIQPMLGSQLVQREGPEPQSGNSLASTASLSMQPAAQPAGVGQSSIALSPPPFPVFRQPYPANYFPFGPYFPSFYLASNAQHLLGHSGLPQHPSTGNVYLSPPPPVPGTKFSAPQGNPAVNAGHLTQFGVLSGNSYSPSPAVTSGNSGNEEDIAASGLKEKNLHSTVQQVEGSLLWLPAPGRDTLHANSFYNLLPPGQHVTFSPPQPNIYHHPTQTMAATSTAPLL